MTEKIKSVSLGSYQQVIELRKKGKMIADIALILRLTKAEVQKIVMHYDSMQQTLG